MSEKIQILGHERVIDVDTGHTLGYYADDHVDKTEFAFSVLEEEEKEISVDEIQHGYMLETPFEEDEDRDDYCTSYLHFRRIPKRGWKPVTFWPNDLC